MVGQEPLHSPFTITLRTLAALIKKLPGQKCFSYLPGSDGNLTLSPSSESNESSESREFCENAESPTAPPPFPTSPMNQANRTASQRLFCCYLCCCCCGAGETFYWILDASSCAPESMPHGSWTIPMLVPHHYYLPIDSREAGIDIPCKLRLTACSKNRNGSGKVTSVQLDWFGLDWGRNGLVSVSFSAENQFMRVAFPISIVFQISVVLIGT